MLSRNQYRVIKPGTAASSIHAQAIQVQNEKDRQTRDIGGTDGRLIPNGSVLISIKWEVTHPCAGYGSNGATGMADLDPASPLSSTTSAEAAPSDAVAVIVP
jgi:hypothetical protein